MNNFSQSLGFILFVIIFMIIITAMLGEKIATGFIVLVLLSMLVLNGRTISAQLSTLGNMFSGNEYDMGRFSGRVTLEKAV